MGKVKKNLLMSVLLLVVMGIFAVLTIFVVVDAVNKKYYEDLNVDYEVQEEAPNIILTFARHEGSEVNNTTTKVVLNEEKDKFRLDGVVPEVTDGEVTNLDEITNENGGEFYFFSTNPAFINVQETPEDPNLIFNDTDARYYVSTEENPIWYDVPTENVFTLYSVFLTPNVHNSDFANAPLNTITNAIVSHDVVNLPEDAFKGSSSSRPSALTTVLLPETLQSIGDFSFQYCGSLTNITIPESVTSVGNYAFRNCISLEAVTFGENSQLESIGSCAFFSCISLTSITIPESMTSIGSSAFEFCSSLTSITIPESVTSIGSYAFRYCSNLTSITIHSSVTSIGSDAFYDCDSLQFNEYENGLYLGNENNLYLALIDATNSDITSFTINQNCKIIAGGAFYNCSSLTSIIIPESVTSIGSSAFSSCSSLTSIIIPSGVTSIGDYAFYNCTNLTSIIIPSSVTSIGSSAFRDCSNLASINIPEGVTEINGYTFYGCSSLTSITIPSSVTSIGYSAFSGCSNIQKLYIDDLEGYLSNSYGYNSPLRETNQIVSLYVKGEHITNLVIQEDVTTIPDSAFCQLSITSVEIPSSVTSIGERAFSYCSSLTSITIPSSVTSIGSDAFFSCSNIQELRIDDLTSYLNSLATNYSSPLRYTNQNVSLYENGNLVKNLVIPEDVTTIPSCAFKSLNITSVEIPNSVTSIGDGAFSNCDSLTSVTFEEDSQLISIGGEAFRDCSSLEIINIPEGITAINGYTFENCDSLTTITIPNSVTSIGIYAFNDCSNLTSIKIPSSVTSIEEYAFQSCHKLVEVYNLSNLSITAGSSNNGYVGSYAIDIKTEESETGIYYLGNNEYVMYQDLKGNHYLVSYNGTGGDITLPNSSNNYSINQYAFSYNYTITGVTIPSSVTSIGNYAFRYCYKLVEVINLSSLEITAGSSSDDYVGYYADYVYTSLDTPLKQQKVGDYIFYLNNGTMYLLSYTGSETNLTLPSIEDIVNVYDDEFTGSTYQIYEYAFYENEKITSVAISSSVTSIGGSAFYNCSSLTSITIPSSVTSIGYSAFQNCSSLTSITIPDSVASIGGSAFRDCSSLTSIIIPGGVTSIGSYAFYNCSSLTSITIPSGVTSIGNYAFYNCNGLTSIAIPSSVTSIGNYAFRDCSRLTIYCEVASRPSGWDSRWNYSNCPVYFGLNVNWEYDEVTRVPTPIEK